MSLPQISDCSSPQIQGLPSLRSSLATMSVHRSTESMTVRLGSDTVQMLEQLLLLTVLMCSLMCHPQAILVPEASEFSQWEPEGAESGCPVTAVIPVWRSLTTLDLSHNCISSIDSSVVRNPQTHTEHTDSVRVRQNVLITLGQEQMSFKISWFCLLTPSFFLF